MIYVKEIDKNNVNVTVLELQRALKNNEFVLHYQPLVNKSGITVGFEGLIRWNHPIHGLVYPDIFIGVSERTGFIVELGKWILKTACYQVIQWQNMSMKPLRLSVNLSIRQLLDNHFVSFVKQTLKETGFPPNLLTVEITESLTDDIQLIANQLDKLKKLGVKISLDDFGTGYNSLYHLKELPTDQIKIDRSFVNDISNPKSVLIVMSMIDVAKSLGVEVVAEGVETETQKDIYSTYCDLMQGYYFAKPLHVHEIERMLRITG